MAATDVQVCTRTLLLTLQREAMQLRRTNALLQKQKQVMQALSLLLLLP
jgi:hypothetical protein